MNKHKAISKLVVIICFLTYAFSSCSTSKSQVIIKREKQEKLIIRPLEIYEQLVKFQKDNPKISLDELIKIGNSLIVNNGYDFAFDTCEILEKNPKTQNQLSNGKLQVYDFSFKDLNNKKIDVEILNRDFGHPCGCRFAIPLFEVNDDKMTVSFNGKKINLKRPDDFLLDEVELVDNNLKKTLRKWIIPGDYVPVGISKNTKKIYLDTGYSEHQIDKRILIEVSENGHLKYVKRENAQIITKKERIEFFPTDNDNDYLGYDKYTDNEKDYIIKFSYPCT